MKSEHSLRELSDPGIQVVDTFYHRIEGYHITGNLLIFASDYQSLKKDSNRLFYIQQDKFRAKEYLFPPKRKTVSFRQQSGISVTML